MSDVRELNEWARTVVVPGSSAVTDLVRLRAASTLRSVREAFASGDDELAEEWLDALDDYREAVDDVVSIMRNPPAGSHPLDIPSEDIDVLNDAANALPPMNERERSVARRLVRRLESEHRAARRGRR